MPDVLSASSTSLEQLRQELERLHLLHATGMELGASLELDELLPLALERMRSAVASTPIETQAGAVDVTVSIGCATSAGGQTDAVSLIARADAALYRAKDGGRNRVEAVT